MVPGPALLVKVIKVQVAISNPLQDLVHRDTVRRDEEFKARAIPVLESMEKAIAVLVFTDGHTEEVSRYMIMGKVMYANADYWTTGTWTKKILLSSLDLRASMRANQERGAKLVLPGGPNEVVIGP